MIDQVKQDISDRGWGDDYEVACVYSYTRLLQFKILKNNYCSEDLF